MTLIGKIDDLIFFDSFAYFNDDINKYNLTYNKLYYVDFDRFIVFGGYIPKAFITGLNKNINKINEKYIDKLIDRYYVLSDYDASLIFVNSFKVIGYYIRRSHKYKYHNPQIFIAGVKNDTFVNIFSKSNGRLEDRIIHAYKILEKKTNLIRKPFYILKLNNPYILRIM